MPAFFAAFDSSLSTAELARQRRKLARMLRQRQIELETLNVGKDLRALLVCLMTEARAAPVIAIDDGCALPDKAPWLAELTRDALTLERAYRPRVIYVTQKATATGAVQAGRHALVRSYIQRDNLGRWVQAVADAAVEIAEEAVLPGGAAPRAPLASPIVDVAGSAPCFCEALAELAQLLQSPYGMVTGERGVGKMFFIRALWRQQGGKNPRVIVLPCGSFYKDYYVAGSRRRIAGGREAVDQLTPYLKESHNGVLVLHHVEQLPTALQEELAVRLPSSALGAGQATRVSGMDRDGLQEYDVRIIATSTFPPDELQQTGRIIRDLAAKLRKRHVRIPSLWERGPEDVRLVCEDILRRIAERQGLDNAPGMDDDVVTALTTRRWPENLSDLVPVLEYALRHCRGRTIRLTHLPKNLSPCPSPPYTLDEIVAEAQRTAIENALERTGGRVSDAARLLGRNEKGLYRLMKALVMPIKRCK